MLLEDDLVHVARDRELKKPQVEQHADKARQVKNLTRLALGKVAEANEGR